MSIGVHKLHKIHCWGWVLLDKTKTAAKGDYRVSFWTRNLDHEVNVCSAVWSWTGQQNEWFLSETGSGFEGLSSKPLPKLPLVLPPSCRPWNSNCLLLCLDFFFTWDPNRFSLKVFWTCKGNLLTSLIWLLDIFFFFSEATVEINKVAHHINENIRQRENFQKMLSIQNALTGEGAPKILAPGTVFIRL